MPKSRFMVIPLATFGLLLTGCAVPSHTATPATVTVTAAAPVAHVVAAPVAAVAAPDADANFLAAVRAGVPLVANAPDSDLLTMGNTICGDLTADGATAGVFTGIAEALYNGGIDSNGAGTYIGAAVGYLCPQFDDAAQAFAAS